MYRFEYRDSSSEFVLLQTPSEFRLPQQLTGHTRFINNIVLWPVEFSAENEDPAAAELSLVKLIACNRYGEIIEALYKHSPPQFDQVELSSAGLPVLSLPRRFADKPRNTTDVAESDLEDAEIADTREATNFTGESKAARYAPRISEPISSRYRTWQHLPDCLDVRPEDKEDLPLNVSLQRVSNLLEGNRKEPFTHLLSDLIDISRITDVEENSLYLDQWLGGVKLRGDFDIDITTPAKERGAEDQYQQLLNSYDDLARAYLVSLASQVTDRSRVNRERLVRQVVGPALLGTILLRPKESNRPHKPIHPKHSSIPTAAVAYLPPKSENEDQDFSQTPIAENVAPEEEPAIARLRQNTEFLYIVPPLLLSHNTGMSIILGHLPVSIQEDPSDYSYQQTNQRMKLVQEQVVVDSLNPKERKKAYKSAARLQRKLQRNQLMSQEVSMQKSLLPTVSTATKPSATPGREVQSSQFAGPVSSQVMSQDQSTLPELSMTQPERGAFGTRQPAKKSKKRRAGF